MLFILSLCGSARVLALRKFFSPVLTSLDLGGNRLIGDDGAKAIAEALKVNPVLTKLDLMYNNLGEAGKQAVRDAVKDRSGFVFSVLHTC